MPIRYNISPELNMEMYVCRGSITAAEIFKTVDMVLSDQPRKPGFITIIDLIAAVENIHLKDIYETIERIEKMVEKGFVPGPILMLSQSRGIHILADTIQMLPSKVPFKMTAFYTMEDAINSLGLSESRQDIIQFWQDSNSLYENS